MQNFGFCRLCLPIIPACVCFHKMAYISKYPPIKFQKTRLIMGWGGQSCFVFCYIPAFAPRPSSTVSFSHLITDALLLSIRCLTNRYFGDYTFHYLLHFLEFFLKHDDSYFSFAFLFFFLQCVNLSHSENLFIEVSSKMTLINFFFSSLPRTSTGSFLRGREIIFFGKHTGTLVL